MNGLVDALRQVARDLIEKRLWPVALVLLAVLIAIPVVIGRASGDAAAPVPGPGPVAAAEPGAGAAPLPASASTARKSVATKSGRRGKVDDPFFDPPTPPSAGAGASSNAAAAGSGAGSTRAEARSPSGEAAPRGGTAPANSGAATAKATPTTSKRRATTPQATPEPTAAAPAGTYLRTVVRVNAASGGRPFPISRLTPIGGAGDPAALFLGVTRAGARYAVFVLGPDATSRGEASCKGATGCRMIGLKAGQTQVVTVRPAGGVVQRFTLRVESVRTVVSTAARARAARARAHPDGRTVLRDMRGHAATAAVLGTARYDRQAGLLRPVAAGAGQNAPE